MRGVREHPLSNAGSTSYTTPSVPPSPQFVTITHPYHPWHGERLRLIRVCRGADPDLEVQLPNGLRLRVAMSCTDYATPQGTGYSSAPPHMLDFNGLRLAAELVERMRQAGRYPVAEGEGESCASDDQEYD